MRVQLDQVLEEAFAWREEITLAAPELECPELVELGPVQCLGDIRFARPGFLLQAQLVYRQTLECHRCLEPSLQDERFKFRLLVLRDHQADENPDEIELDEQELDVVHVDGAELDTQPLIKEQIALNIPMKPLCKIDCSGLCSECGADLNREACTCQSANVDSRWGALKDLKSRLPLD